MIMNKVIKEPLLHFAVLGVVIYMLSIAFSDNSESSEKINVSAGKVEQLAVLYTKTWQRKPTQEQLLDTVNAYVLEQAAYLEGASLGLDENDIVITRRVRQKVDFIAEEHVKRPEITDELLTRYLQNNPDKFNRQTQLTFKQVFFDPKNNGDVVIAQARELLVTLNEAPEQNIEKLGDRYLFKPHYQMNTLDDISRTLGREFSEELTSLASGKWQGPISSSYGTHLVFIEDRKVGELPELAHIKPMVIREWENEQRNKSVKQYYDELLTRYPAEISWPENVERFYSEQK